MRSLHSGVLDARTRIRLRLMVAALVLAWSSASTAQPLATSLAAAGQGRLLTEPSVSDALLRLERSAISRPLLRQLLSSPKAAPYLGVSLPRLANLAGVSGIDDLVRRFASNGQGGAYELAVANAYRSDLAAVSSFLGGNELDGRLRSGTVIESKSAPPRRPEHLLDQIRRRAAGGQRVVLALGYDPPAAYLERLRALSQELGGRLEVHHIPLVGKSYHALIEGRDIENPAQLQAGRGPPRQRLWLPTLRGGKLPSSHTSARSPASRSRR
jgi:hypothetical protein